MTKRKKLVIAIGVILAVALVSGLTTLAVTNYGTQSDPLVTLSYINETVTPGIMSKLQAAIDAKAKAVESEFGGSAETAQEFKVISLSSGQTVTCSVGTEIMLRIGSVSSAGADSPRLIDETTGGSVSSAGTALTKNHMYMVTIKGNGVKATASSKILIRGEYTIS